MATRACRSTRAGATPGALDPVEHLDPQQLRHRAQIVHAANWRADGQHGDVAHIQRSVNASRARDVLQCPHPIINDALFAFAYDSRLPPAERLARMNAKARKRFMEDSIGCLMGVITVDPAYAVPEPMPPIRLIVRDWRAALIYLLGERRSENDTRQPAQQTVADFEGKILPSRNYGDDQCFERVAATWRAEEFVIPADKTILQDRFSNAPPIAGRMSGIALLNPT